MAPRTRPPPHQKFTFNCPGSTINLLTSSGVGGINSNNFEGGSAAKRAKTAAAESTGLDAAEKDQLAAAKKDPGVPETTDAELSKTTRETQVGPWAGPWREGKWVLHTGSVRHAAVRQQCRGEFKVPALGGEQ